MSIERVFLGSGGHCLHAVVDHLQERFPPDAHRWELESLLLLLPGARAGRRLRTLLRRRAAELGRQLVPPSITTIGRLPDRVLVPERATAGPLAELLGWIAAIRAADRPVQDRLLGRLHDGEGACPDEAVEALASRLAGVAAEIAGADLDFEDVAGHAFMEGNADALRWRDLATLQSWQDAWLAGHGIERRDARLRNHLAGHGTALPPAHIGIISADLNPAQRRLLDSLADAGSAVFALVHADADDADAFDGHGCADPAVWCTRTIHVDDRSRHVADGPADQVGCIVDLLGSLDGFDPDDVTIGLPDDGLLPICQRLLPDWGVPVHEPIGSSMDHARIGRLLSLMAQFLESGMASDFAALLREPIFERWIRASNGSDSIDLLEAVDRYREACLPMLLDSHLPDPHGGLGIAIRPVLLRLEELRGDAMDPEACIELVERLLLDMLEQSMSDLVDDDRTVLDRIGSTFDELLQLSPLVGSCTPASLLRLVVRSLARATLSAPRTGAAVDLVGWLECHLDDADTIVIAGCNEGMLPMSLNADPFLPNELRRAIGLVDNDRRLARDAFLLDATLRSGRNVHLVSGRRGLDGDVQIPSRLLLTGSTDRIARDILDFTGSTGRYRLEAASNAATTGVVRCPDPGALPAVDSMSVTAFRDYIACPYRFMLKHVLRLDCRDDEPEELTALSFGSLAHDVLEAFGRAELEAGRPTTDVRALRKQLRTLLDAEADRRFGSSLLPAVRLQIDQLGWRLDAFAGQQAAQARAGWRIAAVELSFGPGSSRRPCDHPSVPFPGRESMHIRGRIDRIDVHEDGKRIRILDYKTGNKAKKPAELHRLSGAWIDLQLPLYRHLVRAAGHDLEHAELGYVALPARSADGVFLFAPWGDDEYASADARAVEIIDAVQAGRFEPSDVAPSFHDDWARICGTSAIELEDAE